MKLVLRKERPHENVSVSRDRIDLRRGAARIAGVQRLIRTFGGGGKRQIYLCWRSERKLSRYRTRVQRIRSTSILCVAFRSSAGELQLCAYQATGQGRGNFLLLNAGVFATPGEYNVPPGWAEGATSYQPGAFLVGVDASRSEIEQISTFADGLVRADEVSVRRVRGTFTVRARLTTLEGGVFDVPLSLITDLPILCS